MPSLYRRLGSWSTPPLVMRVNRSCCIRMLRELDLQRDDQRKGVERPVRQHEWRKPPYPEI